MIKNKHLYFALILGISCLEANEKTPPSPEIVIQLPEVSLSLKQQWKKFHSFVARGLEKFRKEHLEEATADIEHVFYPFGGPDVLYPIHLFPNGRHFTIVGLEHPGTIEGADVYESQQLQNTDVMVNSLLRRSFFITSQMNQQFSKQKGVLPPLFSQLKLMGVNSIVLSKPDLPYPGIKLSFDHNGVQKTIQYYQMNLHNDHLPEMLLTELVNKKLIQGCMLKASSYIPHQSKFSKICDFIINHAQIIIQDDSGIPTKLLEDQFDLHVFGNYKAPYGIEFKGYKQQTMPEMKSQAPFCFGYGCGRQPSVPILAKRKNYG